MTGPSVFGGYRMRACTCSQLLHIVLLHDRGKKHSVQRERPRDCAQAHEARNTVVCIELAGEFVYIEFWQTAAYVRSTRMQQNVFNR